MAEQQLHRFVRRLRNTLGPEVGGLADAQLLERFVASRDEAAFEVLVWRHGPMVLGVCERLLHHAQDAEDVFQATFLALARKAGSIGQREALGGWLHTTAYRTALRVHLRAAQQGKLQQLPDDIPARKGSDEVASDLRSVLDGEIGQLPLKYRLPVILCYLQGKTTEEVARQLGCARGTICSRLSWARERLRSRLSRRGLAFGGAGLVTGLSRDAALAMPAELVPRALQGALGFAAGQATVGVSPQALTLAEGVLKAMFLSKLKLSAVVVLLVSAAVMGASLCQQAVRADKPVLGAAPELVAGDDGALRLPAEMLAPLGIQVNEVRQRGAQKSRLLRVPGFLALDPERLTRIRSRVAGKILEIGKVEEGGESRLIRAGSKVRKDQLLAVVWSKDLGERKGDLVDAQIQLHLDQVILTRLEKLYNDGSLPEAAYRQAQRNVEAQQNTIARLERTLHIWRLPEEDIKAVKEEAKRIAQRNGQRNRETEKNWARLEIRSPLDGTVVERNIAVGEDVADETISLFTITNLDRLLALLQVSKDELPDLKALTPEQWRWTIHPGTDPTGEPLQGQIDRIADNDPVPPSVDPGQRTFVLRGSVENPKGRLRAGQLITAAITLPVMAGEVVVPAKAVVEEDGKSFVFIQPDPKQLVYRQRQVLVVRRGPVAVHIRSPLSPKEQREGFQPLRAGDCIIAGGTVELKAILDDLKAQAFPPG